MNQPRLEILWNCTDKDAILSDDPNIIRWGFSPASTKAWHVLHQPEVRGVCIGGQKGGSKTFSISRFLMLLSWAAMEKYKITPKEDPNEILPIGFFCRYRATDMNKTTLAQFKKAVDHRFYILKEQKKEIIIGNAVKWDFGGLDDPKALNKLNSGEYAYVLGDQGEEFTRDMHGDIVGTGRLVINNIPVPSKLVYSCNPRSNWIKRMFYDNEQALKRERELKK